MRPGKGQEGGFLPLLELPLMMKVLSTWFTRAGRKCNNMDHMDNGAFSSDNLARIKDGAYMINLDDKQSKETHWVSLY